jgi:hypothetical protein
MPETPANWLKTQGYFLTRVTLPALIEQQVIARDWVGLDREIRIQALPGGVIFEALRPHAEFTQIEFIISIRSSLEYPDEDGIWHDDGTRVLAFSLSLTRDPAAIEGGRLEIRKRFTPQAQTAEIFTPPFGSMVIFATGHHGFEHRITRVAAGERIIIAGWCT